MKNVLAKLKVKANGPNGNNAAVYEPVDILDSFFVKSSTGRGVIDHYGRTVIPVIYEKITRDEKGNYICLRTKGKKNGIDVYDANFNLIETNNAAAYEPVDILDSFFVKSSTGMGVIDSKGITKIPLVYKKITRDEKGNYLCIGRGNRMVVDIYDAEFNLIEEHR